MCLPDIPVPLLEQRHSVVALLQEYVYGKIFLSDREQPAQTVVAAVMVLQQTHAQQAHVHIVDLRLSMRTIGA